MSNYIVALTGGIGSGKSTVANLFADYGIDIVDADIVARDVVKPGSEGLIAIEHRFGAGVLNHDGSLNRAALREQVFARPSDREWLNALLHPLIGAQMQRQLQQATSPYCLWVVPLLIENQLYQQANRVLVVDLPEHLQLERASCRDGADPEQIKNIMQAQASRQQRLNKADDVIDNADGPDLLSSQVDKLHQRYLQLSKHAQQ